MLDYNAVKTIVDSLFTGSPDPNGLPNETEFASKVRSASVLLKAANPVSYEDIKRATPGEYYRVALRIAAAKFPQLNVITADAQGAQTLTSSGGNFQWLEDDILAMITPAGASAGSASVGNERLGSFSGGIEWAVSKLVAAHLIRTIPLQSNLKFVDVADNLETQALEDIDRIIRIEQGSASGSSVGSADTYAAKGQAEFCIAHNIDKTLLPDTAFDTPDASISPTNIEVVNTISVDTDEVAFCYFYMTGHSSIADQDLITTRAYSGAEGAPQNLQAVSFKIEKVFPLIQDDGGTITSISNNSSVVNIDHIISEIADQINTETLEVSGNSIANILVAPQRGKAERTAESLFKVDLYPDTTTNKYKQANFQLYKRINKLSFDVRRYSNKATTELLVIEFYTTSISNWTANQGDLKLLRRSSSLGVEGLVYGESSRWGELGVQTPYAALLTVEKGNTSAVSIASDAGGTDSTDTLGSSNEADNIDTFYFYSNTPNFTKDLILRVSSSTYSAEIPLTITVDLTSVQAQSEIGTFVSNGGYVGEYVAQATVDAIYNYTRETNTNLETKDNANILGVLLGNYNRVFTSINASTGTAADIPLEPYVENVDYSQNSASPKMSTLQPVSTVQYDNEAGRVQIVGFKYREEEYKLVIDIIQVPPQLWVATGNYILRRTTWAQGRRRSIQLDLKTLSLGSAVTTQTTAEELASVTARTGKAEASKSAILQRVYDRKKLLNDAVKGFPTKWHN